MPGRRDLTPYLFLLPATAFLFLVVAYPMLKTFILAFYEEPLFGASRFVGLDNFSRLFSDSRFWWNLWLTLMWTVFSVAGKVLIGLGAALLLNEEFKGRSLYRSLMLLPWVTPMVVGAVVFRWLFNGEYGYLNYLLLAAGVIEENIAWLAEGKTAFLAALLNDMWVGIPLMSIVFLAGLQGIPQDLYEAAAVDGASAWQRFRYITLPLLRPVLLVGVTLSVIWTFNSFNIIWVLTGGGPLNATEILVIRTYKTFWTEYMLGMAGSLAFITFVILMVFSIAYWKLLRGYGR